MMENEGGNKALNPDQIRSLLSSTRTPKGITTEPREISVWYKQDHILRAAGCTNPDCIDVRPHSDMGRQIVIKLDNEFMCRYCFLDGWLSSAKTTSN
jgi:hypothetical protein